MADIDFDKDLDTISQAAGLPPRYIRHCLQELKDLLCPKDRPSPYVRHGTNNKLLFNGAAIELFRQIAQQRTAGMTMLSIRLFLQEHVLDDKGAANPDEPELKGSQTAVNPTPPPLVNTPNQGTSEVVELLKQQLLESQIQCDALHDKLDKARDKLFDKQEEWRQDLSSKVETIQQLQQGLLRLTAGQTPQDYLQHQEHCRTERDKLLKELKALEGKWGRGKRRKALLKELETYL